MKRNSDTEHPNPDASAKIKPETQQQKRRKTDELTRFSIPHTLRRHLTFYNIPTIPSEESLVVHHTSLNPPSCASYDSLVFPGDSVQYELGPGQVVSLSPATTQPQRTVQLVAWSKPKGMVIDATRGQPFANVVNEIKSTFNFSAVHPIGQLDKNTTGLYLFSNDGDYSNYINLPGNIEKKYIVTFVAPIGREPTAAQV